MTKIKRTTQKIFGGNAPADDIAIMGSFKSGTPVYTDDVEKLQNTAYEEGYGSAIISNVAPFMEEQNSVPYVLSKQLAYLFQEGIPEYDKDTTYYVGSICKYGGVLFTSVSDNNKGHQPDSDDGTNWTALNTGGGGGLEVCDIGMSLFVDETKGLRRRLNGQIVNINANTQGFLTRLKQITTLYPSLLTDEATWQSDKTLSAYGQVGRFVFNYASDGVTVESVRLPAVVNAQGLMDLANTGFTVPAGLPTLYTNSTGAHYHDRGTMEITGWINHIDGGYSDAAITSGGAFNVNNTWSQHGRGTDDSNHSNVDFYASRSWTGVTSTNGEHSHSIAGTSSTIQPEAIQYPYFIQIATGQETEVDIVNTIELNKPSFFGNSKYVPTPVNNLSWLKSEGQQNPKGSYPDVYNWILENVNNGVEGFKRSAETYTDYDYVINTADETFRLPLLNGSENLPSNTVVSRADNTVINAGETKTLFTASHNGFVSIKALGSGTPGVCTFFAYKNGLIMGCVGVSTNTYNQGTISFDVKCGDIVTINLDYQSMTYNYLYSKAVGNGSLYYYVGETVQNANLIDAGRLGEELVDVKASIDGNWTYKQLQFASSVSIPINTEGAGNVFTYDLSNYLPNDGYKYEVTISVEVNNSSFCTLGYYLPDNSWYSFAKGGNPTGGCFNAIVDSSRQVKISVVNTQEGLIWAHAAAYRRLGKKV